MTFAIAIVLALFVLTVVVFATEWLAMEVYSLLLIVLLAALGILAPEEAFGAFGSSAVLMIAGVMILSGALLRNGVVDVLASRVLAGPARTERGTTAGLLATVNVVSAFINNVAATALFAPVAEGVAKRFRTDPARYLMPVAFASMTGGVCTLIGTSTNIAVSRVMAGYGLEPLGMFELAPLGIAIAVSGTAYLLFGKARKLRSRPAEKEGVAGEIREFLFEIRVAGDGVLTGKTLRETELGHAFGVRVLAILRGDRRIDAPGGDSVIHAGDLLLVKSTADRIARIRSHPELDVNRMPREHRRDLLAGDATIAEATVSHNSPLVSRTLLQYGFRQRHGLTVVAVHRREEVLADKVGRIPLRAGDVLLLYGREDRLRRLLREGGHLLVESAVISRHHGPKALVSLGVFAIAVVSAATGVLGVPTAFLGGGVLIVLLGCLPASEISAHVNLRFLAMVAGMVALGTAMERSGAAALLASGIDAAVGSAGPWALLAAFYVATVALTQPLNNAAAALLVLPIAVHAAGALGYSARPFVVMVTAAASCSFLTPFEPANLLVYGKGHYRFMDFVRVGGVLTLIVGTVCMLLVPALWPFG